MGRARVGKPRAGTAGPPAVSGGVGPARARAGSPLCCGERERQIHPNTAESRVLCVSSRANRTPAMKPSLCEMRSSVEKPEVCRMDSLPGPLRLQMGLRATGRRTVFPFSPGCWRKRKGPAHGSRRQAGRDRSVSKAAVFAHGSPQEAACFSRGLTLFPALCCLIARALTTRSWTSAPEANLRIVLGETLLRMLRSCGKPVVNECGLRVNSAALRFQGNLHLVYSRRYLQGCEVMWIQTDLECLPQPPCSVQI